MSSKVSPHLSWGRIPKVQQESIPLFSRRDPLPSRPQSLLPYGLGRSYGDSCLNQGGAVLLTPAMDRWISFDPQTGLLRCEAGVSLNAILKRVVPKGWFLPVTPGTKYVTLGGAIANDVHGKNHHRAGTFGRHVRCLELLRSDGSRRLCSREENPDWFRATIGGLGLTGLITWAELQLKPIHNPFVEVEYIRLENLAAFFQLATASDLSHEYTVAWVDCLAQGNALGRGVFMRGNSAPAGATGKENARTDPLLSVPVDLPGALLNKQTIRLFNHLYFHRVPAAGKHAVEHYEPFFYPLDVLNHWNRMYGRRGFFQHQCVVPLQADGGPIREILQIIASSGQASFLAVLKLFGDQPAEGLLSFPRPGVTLALDFANRGASTLALMDRLDAVVAESGGSLYPAKDGRMAPAHFQQFYPAWREFATYIDPAFQSSFWRRVTGAPS